MTMRLTARCRDVERAATGHEGPGKTGGSQNSIEDLLREASERAKRRLHVMKRCWAFVSIVAALGLSVACTGEGNGKGSLVVKEQRLIFGEDDRVEYGAITDLRVRRWADSTAAIFSPERVQCSGANCELDLDELLTGHTSEEGELPLCDGEPHRGALKGATCTAFLVGPQLMATAGHCIDSCEDARFVFGFTANADGSEVTTSVPAENVYGCDQIVRAYPAGSRFGDFAVVELDREVYGRSPFPIERGAAPEVGAALTLIGHPLGLPLKHAGNGEAKPAGPSANLYFSLAVDGFRGNSGSPVIRTETGVVEGIYSIRPVEHFVPADDGDGGRCAVLRHCDEEVGCGGSKRDWPAATRTSRIANYVPQLTAECSTGSECQWSPTGGCVVGSCNQSQQCEYDNSACECARDFQCDDGNPCTEDVCFASTYACIHPPAPCEDTCNEETALDLGPPGLTTLVDNNACVRVRDGYPAWWGSSRTLFLQGAGAGAYPVSYTWSSTCGGSGTGELSGSWQGGLLPNVNSSCATLIQLSGQSPGQVPLRYYAQ